jgi:hypothetical protein
MSLTDSGRPLSSIRTLPRPRLTVAARAGTSWPLAAACGRLPGAGDFRQCRQRARTVFGDPLHAASRWPTAAVIPASTAHFGLGTLGFSRARYGGGPDWRRQCAKGGRAGRKGWLGLRWMADLVCGSGCIARWQGGGAGKRHSAGGQLLGAMPAGWWLRCAADGRSVQLCWWRWNGVGSERSLANALGRCRVWCRNGWPGSREMGRLTGPW